jgi:hypothetical protein
MRYVRSLRFAALLGIAGCFGGTETSPIGEIPPPPPPPPITISMGPADAVIAIGGALQYQAISTSTVAGWEWSVLDPTRATISTSGRLTGQAAGTSRVQACATNAPSVCAVADFTVVAASGAGAPAVSVEPGQATVAVGQSIEFAATAVNFAQPAWIWSSMDPATATISPSGALTGRRPGSVVVAACAPASPRYCGTAVVQVQ